MERRPHGANGDFTSRRICNGLIEKLGASNKCNGRSTKEYEMAIWQEKKESLRTEDWQPCVVGEQEYPIKSTLKEARQ